MTISKTIAALLLLTTGSLFAQEAVTAQDLVGAPDAADGPPAAVVKNGFHVYEISGSVGYSTVSSLLGSGSDFRQLGCDCYGVGSVSTGYSHAGPINRIDAVYTPSYTNYYGLTGSKGFNQSMQLAFESRFNSKWKFSLVATASDSSVVEFALQPAIGNSFSAGQDLSSFVNTTMSSMTPGQTLLYGGRVFSAGGRAGLTYRPTTRFRVSFEGGFFQSQSRSDPSTAGNSIAYIIPRAQFEDVNVNMGYSLTPRTEIGGQVSLLNYHTVLGDYRAAVAGATYLHKLSRQWSVFGEAGVGTYIPVSTSLGIASPGTSTLALSGSQFTGSVGLGYQGRESSFFGTYQRMLGDLYGLASSSSQGVQGTWKWRQPGRNWSAYISVGYQRLTGGPLGDGTNWEATAAVTRALSRKTSMSLSYGYLMSNLGPVTVYNNLSAQVVRLTFIFTPVPAQVPGNIGQGGGGLRTTP
jgi:hypothetical protein